MIHRVRLAEGYRISQAVANIFENHHFDTAVSFIFPIVVFVANVMDYVHVSQCECRQCYIAFDYSAYAVVETSLFDSSRCTADCDMA